MSVGQAAFVLGTEGATPISSGTAFTLLNAQSWAGSTAGSLGGFKVTELGVSFSGVVAAEASILVELIRCTLSQEGSGQGTSSAVTLRQVSGLSSISPRTTGKKWYTSEPTTIVPLREWTLDPNKGSIVIQFPLGREPEVFPATPVGGTLGIRITASAATSNTRVRGYMEVEE